MTQDETATVKVEIFGHEFFIRTKASPEYTRMVASYVDHTMREAAKSLPASEAFKVGVLAAMAIADQLFQMKGKLERLSESVEDRARRLVKVLDEGLAEEGE